MKDCECFQEEIAQVILGQSQINESTQNHINSCKECLGFQIDLSRISNAINAIDTRPDPVNFYKVCVKIAYKKASIFMLRALVSAASILIAVICLLLIIRPAKPDYLAFVSKESPGFKLGQGLRKGIPYEFKSQTQITIPQIGLVNIKSGSVLEFIERGKISLKQGEIFATVNPVRYESSNGVNDHFGVVTPRCTVDVLGTRFGVRTTENLDEVYLLEGRLKTTSKDKSLEVYAGEIVKITNQEMQKAKGIEPYIAWVIEHKPRELSLELEGPNNLTLNTESEISLKISTRDQDPAYLESTSSLSQLLYARVISTDGGEFLLNIDKDRITARGKQDQGCFRINKDNPLSFKLKLTPAYFHKSGKYIIYFVYISGATKTMKNDCWTGIMVSQFPLVVEVVK